MEAAVAAAAVEIGFGKLLSSVPTWSRDSFLKKYREETLYDEYWFYFAFIYFFVQLDVIATLCQHAGG